MNYHNNNWREAWKHFWPEGNGFYKKGYVLHHKDPELRHSNLERYLEWRIEDLEMMTKSEHAKLHLTILASPEMIQKRAISNLGKKRSLETKEKMSKSIRKVMESQEVRAKISAGLTGKSKSLEHRKHLSEATTRAWTESKFNGVKMGCPKGYKHSGEALENIRKGNIGKNKERNWYHKDGVRRFCRECPGPGWELGWKLS